MAKGTNSPKNQDDADLLAAITTLVAGNDEAVQVPMSLINQDIAAAVFANSKTLSGISNLLVKKISQAVTDNDNDIELAGTSMLQGISAEIDQNALLLNHLASAAGLLQPGDPLESALLDQTAEAPELAYSASLLLAIKEAMPHLGAIVEVLREIRDRMHDAPAALPGQPPETGEAYDPMTDLPEGVWK
jgi:hypothetical protein